MAVDNSKLLYLLDPAFQIENIAGKPAVGGHIEVFYAGTDVKVITKQNFDGVDNPFKVPLNNDGRAVMLVGPGAKYDIYFYDSFNNLIFSRLNVFAQGEGEGSVSGLTQIFHDDTLTGDGSYHDPLGAIEYTGILPIDVNNDLHLISAQTTRLGVQEPLYFVQDDDEMTVIGLSGGTVPEGTMNESAFGYQDGQITSYNGSAFSAGNTYEAGSYIDIDGNTISVTGLTPVPADTASTGLVASVSADITAMIPDTSDMATQTWVNEQGFLTAHQSLDGLMSADLLEFSGSVITAYSGHKFAGEISGDPGDPEVNALVHANSATWNTVSDKLDTTAFSTVSGDFLTAHQSLDGLMSADLLEISDNKITGYNGTAFAGQGGVTGDYELSAGSGISIEDFPLEQKTVISVTAQGGNPEVEQAVIDNSATWDSVTAKQDSLTFGYHDTAISSIDETALYDNSAHARITTLAGRISDLSSNKLDTTAFSDVSGTFLTAHQDLSDYQTTAGMTAYQEAGEYYSASNPSGFITGVDLTPYQTVEGMTAYQPVGDYYSASNPSGFITGLPDEEEVEFEEIDLTDYQPVSSMTAYQPVGDYLTTGDSANFYTTANESGYLTAVPDTYLQNTDLSTEDGKVTAISGIPLSAGGDVPEGVMVESGLEYNAVQEISGYNGSAIAQYGAEKQFIVHDDTLVHLSNSAQYALGVNLSAVAQLLGVDETEILASTSTSAFTLSEPVSSFKKLEIKVNWWSKNPNCYYPVQIFDTGNIRVAGVLTDVASDGSPLEVFSFSWSSTNGLNYNLARAFAKFAHVENWGGDNTTPDVLSVRGIGRKQ